MACLLSVVACAAWLAYDFAVYVTGIFANARAHSASVRSESSLFLSAEGALSVTIEGAEDWTYGDGERAVLLSPLAEGAEVAYLYAGETAGGAPYESAEQPADAGCYTLTATLSEGGAPVAEGMCTFTIRQRPLALTFAETATYAYTGAPVYPQFSDDRIEGDDLAFSVTAVNAFGMPAEPVSVGANYRADVELSGGADAANYLFAGQESPAYSIGPAELEVRISESTSVDYTGGDIQIVDAAKAVAKTVGGKDGATWSFSLQPFPADPFSPQPETISSFRDAGEYTVYWRASAPNHNERTGKISFTIRQAENFFPLEYARENWVYGSSAGRETYPAPKFGGQTMQIAYYTAAGEPYAGTFGPMTPAGEYCARVTVAGTQNYTALNRCYPFTVERAPLSLRADGTAVYGEGAEEVAYTLSAAGLCNGDSLEALLAAAGAALRPHARSASGEAYAAGSPAGEYAVTAEGSFAADALANYTVTFEEGTLRVEKFPLIASLSPAFDSPVYDGEAKAYDAALSAGPFGESAAAALSYAGAEGALPGAPKDAGSYTVKLSLSGEGARNYSLGGETCVQFEVLPRTLGKDCGDGAVLAIEWTQQRSFVYDGTDKSSLVRARFAPFGGGSAELLVALAAGEGTFADFREGGYLFEAVGFADASLARNYALPEAPLRQATFFIERREVEICVPGGSALFGDGIPALGWAYAGASAYLSGAQFLPEDGIRFSVATDAVQGSPAGEYAAYISACTGGQSRLANYSINGGEGIAVRGTFTVLPAPIDTAGTAGFSSVYDGEVHRFAEEASLVAAVRGGREGSVRWQFFVSGADRDTSVLAEGVRGAGTYTVRYVVTADDHAPARGTFTVTIARASNGWTAAPADVGWTYGEAARLNSLFGAAEFGQVRAAYYASRTGEGSPAHPFVYGEELPASAFGAYTPAGTYYVRLSVEGTGDYAGLEGSAVIRIDPALYDLSGVGYEEVYEYVYDGRAHLPALARLPQGRDGVPVSVRYEGGGSAAGDWEVCAVLTSASPNYRFEGGEARFAARVRILSRPLSVHIEVPDALFGNSPAAEIEVLGLAEGDSFAEDVLPFLQLRYSGTSGSGALLDVCDPSSLPAGSYTVRAYVQACNYTFDVSAPYAVGRAQLRADAFSAVGCTYDGALHTASVRCAEPAYEGLYAVRSEEGRAAGEYAVSLRPVDPYNYCWQGGAEELTLTWRIARAGAGDISVSPLSAADIAVEDWGENAGSVSVKTLPFCACAGGAPFPADGVEWSADGANYSRVAPSQAGKYFVRAYLSESADHAAAVSAPLTFEIAAGVYDVRALSLADGSFVYDGTFRTLALAGELPVGADGIALSCTLTGGRADAGQAEVRALLTSHSPNYTFAGGARTLELVGTLTVLPRPVRAVWVLPEGGFTYNGEVQHSAQSPSIRAYYSDVSGRAVWLPVGESADGPFRDFRAEGYLFSVACADANYALEGGQMRVQMGRAPLKVIAEDKQSVFGGEEAPLTWVAEGELFGQEIAVSLSREGGADAGEYAIRLSLAGAENFDVTAVGGVYTILPAPSSLRVQMEGWTYGDGPTEPLVSGGAGELTFRYVGTSNAGAAWDSALPPEEAGSYALVVTDVGSANVCGGSARADFSVGRALLPVPTLGGSGASTFSASGEGGGDSLRLTGFVPAAMTLSGGAVRAEEGGVFLVAEGKGTYTVRVRLSDTDNYAWEGGEEVVLVWRSDVAAAEDAWLIGVAATFSVAGAGALVGAYLFGKARGRRRR